MLTQTKDTHILSNITTNSFCPIYIPSMEILAPQYIISDKKYVAAVIPTLIAVYVLST